MEDSAISHAAEYRLPMTNMLIIPREEKASYIIDKVATSASSKFSKHTLIPFVGMSSLGKMIVEGHMEGVSYEVGELFGKKLSERECEVLYVNALQIAKRTFKLTVSYAAATVPGFHWLASLVLDNTVGSVIPNNIKLIGWMTYYLFEDGVITSSEDWIETITIEVYENAIRKSRAKTDN